MHRVEGTGAREASAVPTGHVANVEQAQMCPEPAWLCANCQQRGHPTEGPPEGPKGLRARFWASGGYFGFRSETGKVEQAPLQKLNGRNGGFGGPRARARARARGVRLGGPGLGTRDAPTGDAPTGDGAKGDATTNDGSGEPLPPPSRAHVRKKPAPPHPTTPSRPRVFSLAFSGALPPPPPVFAGILHCFRWHSLAPGPDAPFFRWHSLQRTKMRRAAPSYPKNDYLGAKKPGGRVFSRV